MIINKTKYLLPDNNFIKLEAKKNRIILADTFNKNMRHFYGWLHRYNGGYRRTAAFTISKEGTIFQHFDPKYASRFLNLVELDVSSIIVLLENEGWLTKNDEEKYITWIGDIYNETTEVVEKRWRGQLYWPTYSKEQFDSTIKLCKHLCGLFDIPSIAMSHNTKVDKIMDYNGILYKSNIDKYHTDLNPSWNFDLFKKKIEHE